MYVEVKADSDGEYSHPVADATRKMPLFIYIGDNADSENLASGKSGMWPTIVAKDGVYIPPIAQSTPTPTETPTGPEPIMLNANQIRPCIVREDAWDISGRYIDMNSDGSRIIIGAIHPGGLSDNLGQFDVFEWNNTNWTPIGDTIIGEVKGDKLGNSVCINSIGDRVAAGSWGYDPNGGVKVYTESTTGWTLMGNVITGEEAGSRCGDVNQIGFDTAGDRIVVGSYGGGGPNEGNFRVFEWNGVDWSQMGETIYGDRGQEELGTACKLNADGSRVVVSLSLIHI